MIRLVDSVKNELALILASGQYKGMNSRIPWRPLSVAGLCLCLTDRVNAFGITAVTRRTVMGGVPTAAAAPAPTAPGNNGAIVYSPQPAAAAAMLLPGQTPLAIGAPRIGTGTGTAGVAPVVNGVVGYPWQSRPAAVPQFRPGVPVRTGKVVAGVVPLTGTNLPRPSSVTTAR